jgi:hypothetical protein
MRIVLAAALIVSACLVPACSLIRVNAVISEERQVDPLTDERKTVTFREPVVWTDAPISRASKGVRLPKGVYILEAKDADYFYFRAPAPIEMRVIQNGRPVEGQDVPGGVALAKWFFITASPVAYIDVAPGRKMLVMKLGYEFMTMRGKQWEKNF